MNFLFFACAHAHHAAAVRLARRPRDVRGDLVQALRLVRRRAAARGAHVRPRLRVELLVDEAVGLVQRAQAVAPSVIFIKNTKSQNPNLTLSSCMIVALLFYS